MSLYKTVDAQSKLMALYDKKLAACHFEYEDQVIETSFGKTHLIVTGPEDGPVIVIFHGINAGAPMAMQPLSGLSKTYRIIGVDTPGQANKSSERRLKMKGDDYANWLKELMIGMNLKKATFIGVSYGAFLLQKLIASQPESIEKAIFIVPSGFVKGKLIDSLKKLSWPLVQFLVSKKEKHLLTFLNAFYSKIEKDDIEMQKTLLLEFKMDYARPLLMSKEESEKLSAPVSVMVADDDVFFPGNETLERCMTLFSNLKNTHVLKNSKHIPSEDRFPEISKKIEEWLVE